MSVWIRVVSAAALFSLSLLLLSHLSSRPLQRRIIKEGDVIRIASPSFSSSSASHARTSIGRRGGATKERKRGGRQEVFGVPDTKLFRSLPPLPARMNLLFIGDGTIGDLYTALCHAVHPFPAEVPSSSSLPASSSSSLQSTPWCPDYDDHIHDEYINLPKGGMARYLYWDGQAPLALSPFLCTDVAAAGWDWPTHVIFGRGLLDLYHLNLELDDVVLTTHWALGNLSAAVLSDRASFCARTSAVPSPSKNAVSPRILWLLPRYVPERPYHVGCTTELRQVELLNRFHRLAADASSSSATYGSITWMLDMWSHTRSWPNDAFDYRGLALRRTDQYRELLVWVLRNGLHAPAASSSAALNNAEESSSTNTESRPGSMLSSSSSTLAFVRGLWASLNRTTKFSVPWGPTGGGRHCNASQSYPAWFAADTTNRRLPTLFWKHLRHTCWRLPKHRFGPPTRWKDYDQELRRVIKQRNAPPPTGEVPIHWDKAPCGSVPEPYDEKWEYNLRQLGTKWPTKPSSPEVPCGAFVVPPSKWKMENIPPIPETLGPARCVFFWGPAEEKDNNWPEIDLEGCLAHGQIRALYIGASHQDIHNVEVKWFGPSEGPVGQHDESLEKSKKIVKGASRQVQGIAKNYGLDGINVFGFRWNPMTQDLGDLPAEAPIWKSWTHVILGATSHGNIFQDWSSEDASMHLRKFMSDGNLSVGISPDRVQLINFLEVHFRGRRGSPGSSDPCSQEFRIEMYRESVLCAAVDLFRDWKHHAPLNTTSDRYRTGLRYFNPKPMTKHPLVELLSPMWDGHHFSDTVIGDAMYDHQVRLMCNEWIAEKTSARPLRINGFDGLGFKGTEMQPESASEPTTISIPSATGGFPLVSMPQGPPPAQGPSVDALYKGDPRHKKTMMCGCLRAGYSCGHEETAAIDVYMQIAGDMKSQKNLAAPVWIQADDRVQAYRKSVRNGTASGDEDD